MAICRKMVQPTWDDWLSACPPSVQQLAALVPPDRLYIMWSTGHRVTVEGYSEDGTLAVAILGTYNRVAFERWVFGVPAADLVECDLPHADEEIGAMLTDPQEIEECVERLAAMRTGGTHD